MSILNNLLGSLGGTAKALASNPIVRTMGQVGANMILSSATQNKINNVLNSTPQGLASQITSQFGKYVFSKASEITLATNQLRYYGFTSDVTGNIPQEYLIKIQNKKWVVRGLIQKDLQMSVTGTWQPFIPQDFTGNLQTVAAFFNTSFMPRWTSRNIWRGTSPIILSISLKFEAVHDARTEVVLACLRLKQMASPGCKDQTVFGVTIPMLQPPGPAPGGNEAEAFIKWSGAVTAGSDLLPQSMLNSIAASTEGDRIIIKYGTFLNFTNVVIKDVSIRYSPKMTSEGFPISAEADVTFQTYQIETKETLQNEIYTKIGEYD